MSHTRIGHDKPALWTGTVLALAFVLSGCVSLPQSDALKTAAPASLPRQVALEVPFFGERDNYCGPSSLAMVLGHAGVEAAVPDLAEQVFLPGREGSVQVEMLAAPRAYALVGIELAPRLEDVLRELAAGTPVLMLVNLGFKAAPAWHYWVATGYDLDAGELRVHSAPHRDQRLRFDRVEYLWRGSGHWSMVAVPPGRVPASVDAASHSAALSAFERVAPPSDATAAWRAHLARWPGHGLGWFALGNRVHAEGDLAAAERSFRAAVDLDRTFSPALNNLALTLASQGRLDEAIVLAEQGVALGGAHRAALVQTLDGLRQRRDAGAALTRDPPK